MSDKNYIQEITSRIRDLVGPSALPKEGDSELLNSYALLVLAKGESVTNEDVHDAWSVWATKYAPDSESLVPYSELSDGLKEEDTPYAVAIRAAAKTIDT